LPAGWRNGSRAGAATRAPRVLTAAGFARLASGGRWLLPPHLAVLNRKLMAVASGRCRRLLVTMPPRHGKSQFCSQYYPAFYLGSFPDRRVILASYEADFAAGWGRKVRDLLQEHGPGVFGVSVRRDSTAANRWGVEGRPGGMDTAGVGGPITGKGADLLVIDDPVKNAEEAASPTFRAKTWDWYASTAYTRLEPGGAVVLIQTRWHADDLAGRILAGADSGGEPWDVLNLPALAEDADPLGRAPGEALWPERFDTARLGDIRRTIGEHYFAALYQQRPTPREGGFFRRSWLPIVDAKPHKADRVRAWDKAATDGGGDWTAGVLMARTPEGLYYVEDVVRGRWGPGERDRIIRQTAELDGKGVPIVGEREGGSGGKDSALAFVRLLAGFSVHTEPATGSKEIRADALASQAEVGNVRLLRGPWNAAYIEELASFPSGAHDDQVDASSLAFNTLADGPAVLTVAPDLFAGIRGF
jgi:predicted phage terminase large subunit-like protein